MTIYNKKENMTEASASICLLLATALKAGINMNLSEILGSLKKAD